MATIHTLSAETRQRSGSSEINRMRKEGIVPAVIYGAKQENANLKINRRTISELLRNSASENILVDLEVDSGEKRTALIQDVQSDPLSGNILHVDFRAVLPDQMIHANVPVNTEGEAPGVAAGGQLEQIIHSLMVNCLPKDLPDGLIVDVSGLEIGDNAQVKDIAWPEGVTASTGDDVIVAQAVETRVAMSEAAEGEDEAAEGEESTGEDAPAEGEEAAAS